MNTKSRVISILLAIVMMIAYMPAMAFAEAEEGTDTGSLAAEQVEDTAAEQTEEAASEQADDPYADQKEDITANETAESVGDQSTGSKRLASEQYVYINPAYEDVLTEKDIAIGGFGRSSQLEAMGADETPDYSQYETDESKIAATLRQAMVDRKETVPLYFRSSDEVTEDQVNSWIEDALSVTDSPVEGDYLFFTFGGSGFSVDAVQDGDSFYTTVTMYLTYYTTAEQEQELTAALNKVMAGFGFTDSTSDYKKIETIYNYICENVTYDYDNLNDNEYFLKYTAYAALINKTAVCQGYSNLLYRMLKMAGVDSRIVAGTSHNENHSWNIARIDGLYYNLDSTWDAGVDWYGFFLKGSETFPDHTSNNEYLSDDFVSAYPISASDYVSPDDKIITSGDFQYEVKNGKAALIKYSGSSANVTVPASVEGFKVIAIAYMAFNNCESLERLTLSEGIKALENESIYACNKLRELDLPSTLYIPVESGEGAVSGISYVPINCYNLETVKVASGSKYLTVVDGVLFDKDRTSVLYYPPGKTNTEYRIPDGVKSIGSSSFEGNSHITKVTMPDSVTYIGYWAFNQADKLRSVNISRNCTMIGQYAFSGTAVERLELPAALELIDVDYSYYPYLKEWIVDKGNKVYSASEGILLDKSQKTIYHIPEIKEGEYVVPDTVTSIYQRAACNSNLSKITIPASAAIGSENFLGCRDDFVICGYDESPAQRYAKSNNITFKSLGGFETVEIDNGTCGSSMKWTFDNKGVLRISGTGTIYWEGNEPPWESYRTQISKVIIENGPEEIMENAFFWLTSLSSVTISGSVKKIKAEAFASCNALSEVNISEGVEDIGESAFFQCGITDLSLPSSVTHIGSKAFAWNPLKTIKVNSGNKHFTSKDNVLFSKDGKELVQYPLNGPEIYRVPDGVTTIGPYAFAYANIKDLYCPDSLQTVGDSAFSESRILYAHLGEGIREIGANAFFNSDIRTLAAGKSLKTIREGAFSASAVFKTVFFRGSEADWKAVAVEPYNQELTKAEVRYLGSKDFCSSNVHSLALVKPYKEATEKEEGNIEYYKCTKCGKLFTDSWWDEERLTEITEAETIIPATGTPADPEPSDEPADPSGTEPDDPAKPSTDTDTQTDPEKPSQIGTPEIKLSATDFTYKYKVKKIKKKKKAVATVQKPAVQSVTLNGKTISAANYDVTWSNEKSCAIGEYSVTVTLKGDYSGKASATYRINPKAVKLKKVKAGKKRFTASWKKLGKNDIKYKAIGGYQLRYATDPEFTDEKIVSGGSLKKTSKTVKKLQKKKTYYVQLRTYKKVGGKYFYSGWSATKKVKIKK